MMQQDTWIEQAVRAAHRKGAGEIIPTWQVGQEQPQANPLLNYATEGYSKNSLAYSCVRQIATSFAGLGVPVVERADKSVVRRHRVLRLLANPNTYQSWEEFADDLASHYQAAANVYIHKVRISASRARRSEFEGYPVQELQLIRPDYVTIQPGNRREDDVFVVTVGGTVRQRIPRADIIHIHDPNLINDFYGLSKFALLTNELNVDNQMSAMELTFFKNAGVPFGLLYLKGRTTQERITETKSAFARAFNGFGTTARKWFDLLVLNQDEAKYEQIASNPDDMEKDSTRFHVESRTCAVWGIPPILVGARVAMQGNTLSYQEAQYEFWAETMVPFARRVASSFTRSLLEEEFALVADDGASISFDFTQVRALQEDRSLKLREVVRLVLTGGFTVNQAMVSVGLPTFDGGDFYVRNGNQVIARLTSPGVEVLEPMAPSGASTPNANNPLEGAAGFILDEVEEMLDARRK